jgi:hypothetical protein
MTSTRRAFLKLVAIAPFVPLATRLAAATELAFDPVASVEGERLRAEINGLVAASIEIRSERIENNLSVDNTLFAQLRAHDVRMRNDIAYRRKWSEKNWRKEERWFWNDASCNRHQSYARSKGKDPRWVRVDSRCPSGFRAWAEEHL